MEMPEGMYRTPLHYIKIFFRRKHLFLLPVVLGLILGIAAGFVLPKTYESATVVLVEEGRVINPLIQGLAVSTSLQERLRTLREQILSWDRLMQLTKRLQLAKGIKSQYDYEQLILKLRKKIGVGLNGPSLIRISYQSSDPVKTQLVVKTVTDIFIEENIAMQNRETETAIGFINDQLSVYKRKIKESELAQLEDELKNLLVDSTDQHPRVIELRTELARVQGEIDSGNFKIKSQQEQPSNPIITQIQGEIARIQENGGGALPPTTAAGGARGLPDEKLYNLLLLDSLSSVFARDIAVNERIYNMLLQRLETAKITRRLEASREGTRYTVLDPARLPLKPIKPNKILTTLMGLFLGALVGFGIVFCVEFFDRSFVSVDEAKDFLSGPILGAISKITTEKELDFEHRKKRFFGLPVFTHACATLFGGAIGVLKGKRE